MTLHEKTESSWLNRSSGLFSGPAAIHDFLNPEKNPPLPLVELPGRLNPLQDRRVRIFAKLMYLLPLLNLKSLPSLNMLLEAQAAGKLEGVEAMIENSSGNTAFSLGILAPIFNVPKVVAMVPWDIAPGKFDLLRLSGVEPRLTKSVDGAPSGICQASEKGKCVGWFNPAQYENQANPSAIERWVAPEIWSQTGEKLTVFATGMGTSGTLMGAANYYRKAPRKVWLLGAICAPASAVPGVRTETGLREIGFAWREAADCIVEVETKESYQKSMELCRCGLMAGPSSGLALSGLLKFLHSRAADSDLDSLRNEDGEVIAAFICPDTPLPYLDKYSTHLDPADFQ